MAKIKTISLSYGYNVGVMREPLGYRVERVTDSVEFNPGDVISKYQADELCKSKNWKVTINKTATA